MCVCSSEMRAGSTPGVACAANASAKRGVQPSRGGQRGGPSRVAVPRDVVAAEDRDPADARVAPVRERGSDAFERRALAGLAVFRGRLGVPGFRDGEREDQRRRRGDQLRHGRVVTGRRVHVAHDRADDLRRGLAARLHDQRIEAVLAVESLGHEGVGREEAESHDPPVASLRRQLVRVHREVRPVEATNPHVDDGRLQARAVIGRHGDSGARDLGELRLAESDGSCGSHVEHHKQRWMKAPELV